MATATKDTQRELHKQALEQLEIIGGKLVGEDDITFSGTGFNIPAHLSLREGWDVLGERVQDEENEHSFSHVFDYRPLDGAHATMLVMREKWKMTLGQSINTFFGRQPPQFIDVRTGPHAGDVVQVPWGAMRIPGMKGAVIHLGASRHPELGEVFSINAKAPRRWRWAIQGFFSEIEKKLKTHSIYKGKCIDGGMNFFDPYTVHRDDMVFTQSVTRRLEGDLWAFIRHAELLQKLGQDGKFAVLLAGTYGVGKSLVGQATGQECMEADDPWTFVMCRPGQDDLAKVIELAKMYPPAVLFAEDLDVMAGPQSGNTIERYLDVLDGVKAKGLRLLSVFTTNHPEDIHQGMLRVGRIGAVIRLGAMDRPGVEKLTRRVVGDALDPETDFDEVFKHLDGYMPAFIRGAIDRSVRYAVTLNEGELGQIGTEALCLAADSLRDQHELMAGAREDVRITDLATALEKVVRDGINGTEVVNTEYEETQFTLAANGR